jgi:hypothetical protein
MQSSRKRFGIQTMHPAIGHLESKAMAADHSFALFLVVKTPGQFFDERGSNHSILTLLALRLLKWLI